ncbi:MAG: hypothetical protein IPK82_03970 [Polyangiaceae bacterium]|nr:hypothetical protein [Polyangiaceae bacterium]
MARAKDLQEAYKLLDPRPLDFSNPAPTGRDVAKDPAFYAPTPDVDDGGTTLPGPVEMLLRALLVGGPETKMFLSGHVGSGKSTELSRLAVDPRVQKKLTVVSFRIEEHEWAIIDSTQLLFRLAGELFAKFKDGLLKMKRWREILGSLNDRLFEKVGLRAEEGATSLEFDLLIAKVRTELKLSERVRQQFRSFGETNSTILQDFIKALVDDIGNHLAETGQPDGLLVLVDDLDKVRGVDSQRELFETNLNVLLTPPMRIVYTLPTGVTFGANRLDVRANTQHFYPIRVLHQAPKDYNPEDAVKPDRLAFFESLISRRVEDNLIQVDAIHLAAAYSGGVLREFFRLLRDGILIADYQNVASLDGKIMRYAIKNAQRTETLGLYGPDYEALAHVHRTNQLRSPADRTYLDQARILECYNGSVWFEANPLIWPFLKDREADGTNT